MCLLASRRRRDTAGRTNNMHESAGRITPPEKEQVASHGHLSVAKATKLSIASPKVDYV